MTQDAPAHNGVCAHAEDRAARAPLAIARAEEACAARQARLTPIRRQVLKALYSTHRPMSAYEIIEALCADGGKRHAPVTVYRALDFLLDNALAHRLESRNAFIACPFHHGPADSVVFMICDACGGVDETVSEALRTALGEIAFRRGFTPRMRIVELEGLCAHCRA